MEQHGTLGALTRVMSLGDLVKEVPTPAQLDDSKTKRTCYLTLVQGFGLSGSDAGLYQREIDYALRERWQIPPAEFNQKMIEACREPNIFIKVPVLEMGGKLPSGRIMRN